VPKAMCRNGTQVFKFKNNILDFLSKITESNQTTTPMCYLNALKVSKMFTDKELFR
jgi:hypothetical protein